MTNLNTLTLTLRKIKTLTLSLTLTMVNDNWSTLTLGIDIDSWKSLTLTLAPKFRHCSCLPPMYLKFKILKLSPLPVQNTNSNFLSPTQWCDVKPIFVLMEMADRAGDGSTKLQINFWGSWSRVEQTKMVWVESPHVKELKTLSRTAIRWIWTWQSQTVWFDCPA